MNNNYLDIENSVSKVYSNNVGHACNYTPKFRKK